MVASNSFLNYLLRTAVILYHEYGIERSSKSLLDSYDFVIVGGGSAGAIVAAKLSVNPLVNVLLIESGGSGSHITDIPFITNDLVRRTNMSRKLYTTAQRSHVCNDKPCVIYNGHQLGGGSTHNGMVYVRGSKQDFTDWSSYGIKGWSYEDVLPYMVELETYEDVKYGLTRGTKGPIHVTRQEHYPFDQLRKRWKRAAIESGHEIGDYNGPRQTYFGDMQKNIRDGVRESTDNVYLKPIMGKRPNLHVIMLSHITRILFSGNTAIGVEYSRNDTLFKVLASREVILSAGTFGSPQILLLSGIGPAEQLKKFNLNVIANLPGVGRNFQDHYAVFPIISTNQSFPKKSYVTEENYELWTSKKRGILSAVRYFSIGFVASNYSVNSNDAQIVFESSAIRDDLRQNMISLRLAFNSIRTLSRGNVELRNTNPFGSLIVDPNYLARIEDKHNVINAMKIALSLMKSKPFRQINSKLVVDSNTRQCSKQFTLYSDDWLYCYIQKNGATSYHYTSTCRMGATSDALAVVDDRLRVRNVQNLRIVDASVMPQVTRGNTNAPTMMIGLKGAAMILQDMIK